MPWCNRLRFLYEIARSGPNREKELGCPYFLLLLSMSRSNSNAISVVLIEGFCYFYFHSYPILCMKYALFHFFHILII